MALLTILARCRRTGQMGLAAYADRRAISARLGRIRPGVGVCAAQGVLNPRHEKWALDLLTHGITPNEALISSCLKDKFADRRQILLLSATGEAAAHEGAKRPRLASTSTGRNFAVGGTDLPSLDPVEAVEGFLQDPAHLDVPLGSRLLGAMEAAKIEGLPIRGDAQSSCLKVLGGNGELLFDLRVDAGPTPIIDLRRLLDRAHQWHDGAPAQEVRTSRSRRSRAA